MAQTSRELVRRALKFERPERVPRQLWMLPWARERYPEEAAALERDFPPDISGPPSPFLSSPRVKGAPYEVGEYVDEWGCVFDNAQRGVIGEVKRPQLEELSNWRSVVKAPYETLPQDASNARDAVNRACASSDKFMLGGCPRPWERYQFIRGSESAMMDMALLEDGALGLLQLIHSFYMKQLELWCSTDVDGISFMDDWGSQRSLLINPETWRQVFKPLYKDYCDIAKAHGKMVFMHSDGCIQQIYPDLIELGVDAVNSQLGCMDLKWLEANAKGRIAFWGEVDRQQVLVDPNPERTREEVRRIARHLYQPEGGVIAQLEFGPGASPAAVRAAFEEWDSISGRGGA